MVSAPSQSRTYGYYSSSGSLAIWLQSLPGAIHHDKGRANILDSPRRREVAGGHGYHKIDRPVVAGDDPVAQELFGSEPVYIDPARRAKPRKIEAADFCQRFEKRRAPLDF
jgi:hypothetical protein